MKVFSLYAIALASAAISNAVSVPDVKDLTVRDAFPEYLDISEPVESDNELFKRKGGGGRGGGGGVSSGGSSSSGGSTGGSSSGGGSRGGSGSGSGSSGGTRGGGSTTPRVGTSYGGGGRFYGGGASTAYRAGGRSPAGIRPFLFASPLLIFPGLWLAGAYAYSYPRPYAFYNRTATNSSNPDGTNQTKPVECLCAQYQACGCDQNDDRDYLDSIIGNGSYRALNKTLVNVADVNGTDTIVINGTLPNSTTDGDDDDSSSSSSSSDNSGNAAAGLRVAEWSGYWIMALTVIFAVWA